MNIFSRIYCRAYQITMRVFSPFLPFREPERLTNYFELAEMLKEQNIERILLVTDKVVNDLGLPTQLQETLNNSNFQIVTFDEVEQNPTVNNVEHGVEVYNNNNCQAIIGFGGGSPIDCAKAIGARIALPNKKLTDMKGLLKVNHKLPLLIAVPTTAGTGSEATLSAVITDENNKHKYIINDFDLIPNYALLDANLTLTLPKELTAVTGIDALTHAIEAYIGKSTTKTTIKNSLRAIKLIFENFETAYNDGKNLEARNFMLKASFLAGKAFTKAYVGYVHAIAHTLGGEYGISHGFANGVILPYMLRMYGKSVYKKLHKIGVFVGLFDETMELKKGAKIVIRKIEQLNQAVGIPAKIKCIKEEDIEFLAKKASSEANPLYPVPKLLSAKQLQAVYYMIKE